MFSANEKPNSPSLQPDETDELADVLTGIDQTTLSFQDLYVNDDDATNYKRQNNDPTGFTSQLQSNSQQNSSGFQYAQGAKSANPLYSPSSSIYPTLSPTEGDIRGNAPPFTLGTPGGGYQGIQAGYQTQSSQVNTQSADGIYSSSTSDSFGNTNSQQTTQSVTGQYSHLDMSGAPIGMGGAHVDPQLMHAMNGYYMSNAPQGMFPEYFMGITSNLFF